MTYPSEVLGGHMIKGYLADQIYKNEMEKMRKLFPEAEWSDIRPSRAGIKKVQTIPEIWLERFVSGFGISYEYKTGRLIFNGRSIKDDELYAHISLYLLSQNAKLTKSQVKDAVLVWKFQKEQEFTNKLRNIIAHAPEGGELVADWVFAITGKRNKLDIAVMKHFIWQTKRKIFGLEVGNHMMPVLYGKSGGGKSVAVSSLIKPLSDVALNSDMSLIEDQLFKKALGRNYVVFFDELAGSNRIDVNSLKQVITADRMEWRGIRSENMVSGSQNCTFIGCTNMPVVQRVLDSTSMRRFWQLNCRDKINWDLINTLNYLSLWKSVDEQSPSPIEPVLSQIKRVQEGLCSSVSN